MLKAGRIRPALRRVLAIDPGSRCLKLLLAESDFRRLRILKEHRLDLSQEGLVSPTEIRSHLHALFTEWENPALSLVLPQHLSISQVVDLPLSADADVEKLIEAETVKLSGVSESKIIYDFVRTESGANNRQQFWVTLSRETDIRDRIGELGLEPGDLCEITTTANALMAAYRAACPLSSRAILVHAGAQSTLVVILLAGQAAFATSFPMGGDFLTRSLANERECAEETAEMLKRQQDFLTSPEKGSEFASAVDGWASELKRQLEDWFQNNRNVGADLSSFDMAASGSTFDLPGLLPYVERKAGLKLTRWPEMNPAGSAGCTSGFEVAFGAALQALGYSPQPVSLLPADYRAAWKKRLSRQRLEIASAVLLVVCALVLGVGTWHKLSLLERKTAMLAKVRSGLELVQANSALAAELASEYEALRPVFMEQQNTLDTLKALSLLQQSRGNRGFWYVLVADQHSYFHPPPTFISTNRPARTNASGSIIVEPLTPTALLHTNAPLAKPGLIAEVCVPGEPEASRKTLSQLVNDLNQQRLFSKVDLLSDDLRRQIAEPKVVVPDRHFALAMDFAETSFQPSARQKPPRSTGKRATRAQPDPEERPLP